MDSRLSAKLVTLFLVLSVLLLSYSLMSSRADLGGTNGMVTIDNAVIIRQGDGVNYTFGDTEVLRKLEVKATSIELDDWFEIGASVSSGYLDNVIHDWRSDYVKWTAEATDSTAQVSYTVTGLAPNTNYDCIVDDVKYRVIACTSVGTVQFSYADGWSSHTFVLSKSSAPVTDLQASFEYTIQGNLVSFYDKSLGDVTVWIWNFGDGTGSTKQNPSHQYTASGKYTVSLTIYDMDAHSDKAQTEITLTLGPGFPIERDDEGWNVFVTEDLTLSISALGLLVFGAILYASAIFLPAIPVFTPKGRKIVALLMIVAGIYWFTFIDNKWLG